MSSLAGSVVLVTGANGGLGAHFVQQALDRGAAKVYAAARTPREWSDSRIVPVQLDVTDAGSIARAAEQAADTTVLINNAGISNAASLLSEDLTAARAMFETNFWGALAVTNALLPSLRSHRGTVLNVLSVLSWLAIGNAYSASKAALWSATNAQRIALQPEGVHVAGLFLGYADTPMTRDITAAKLDPVQVVASAYDGIESGEYEILADELSRQVRSQLSKPVHALYPALADAAS